MDSATATIVVGGLVGVGGLASALVTGFIGLRNSNKTLAVQVELNRSAIAQKATELSTHRDEVDNELSKEMRLELRAALADTREELKICREEVAGLRKAVEALTSESKISKGERDREAAARLHAEQSCELLRASMTKAECEITALRADIVTLRADRDALRDDLDKERSTTNVALRSQGEMIVAKRERERVLEEIKQAAASTEGGPKGIPTP